MKRRLVLQLLLGCICALGMNSISSAFADSIDPVLVVGDKREAPGVDESIGGLPVRGSTSAPGVDESLGGLPLSGGTSAPGVDESIGGLPIRGSTSAPSVGIDESIGGLPKK